MRQVPFWEEGFDELDEFAMRYEVGVLPLFDKDYRTEFFDFYQVTPRGAKLIPAEGSFEEAIWEVSGASRGEPIARKAEALFGRPKRMTVFDDDSRLRDELGGRRGLSPFFFVFGILFCEYERFTLCFLSGSNN